MHHSEHAQTDALERGAALQRRVAGRVGEDREAGGEGRRAPSDGQPGAYDDDTSCLARAQSDTNVQGPVLSPGDGQPGAHDDGTAGLIRAQSDTNVQGPVLFSTKLSPVCTFVEAGANRVADEP